VFGLNDVDVTLPAPVDWDVKRLAASVMVAAPRAFIPLRRVCCGHRATAPDLQDRDDQVHRE
jgi:Uncharacterized protein conserved in bacteria (DUF2252)